MKHKAQRKIPATYMRRGTSKGVFFKQTDLPQEAQHINPVLTGLDIALVDFCNPNRDEQEGLKRLAKYF